MKTLIVGNKDGKIAFYNVADNYRQIAVFDATKDMGIPKGDSDLEVNALSFITMAKSQYLAVGTNTGQIALVDLSTQKMCFLEEHFISSETLQLYYNESDHKLYCLNQDQNLFTY
jgi:WD40 repeat protein